MNASTLRFDTGQLSSLRKVIAQIPALRASIGDIAQFRLIVDANFVIGELIYRVRHPNRGASALMESIRSTVIEVFAPRWLETEITMSAIPKVAKRRRIPEDRLRAEWLEFRSVLKWDDMLNKPGVPTTNLCDPKDLPYIELERKLDADGILSSDVDIARMGGHALTLDFVLCTRSYARSVVTNVSIRVMGVIVPTYLAIGISKLVRHFGRSFGALPYPVRALLILSGAIALLHPNSRKWILSRCASVRAVAAPVFYELTTIIKILAASSAAAEAQASTHLQQVTRAVKPRINAPT